ncbi:MULTISPECIES: transposase domain-containing protein [Butyrivibrio]|uniref:transposase domain-containing protein n=1 Tax=Butyrivibrio TaxID=830 RepID=UPI002E8E25B8|nr:MULTISPECIES: transposase domain-containing protein [Butyrivibrio]
MESDNGAKASAMIFSIAETAKVNAINTYEYFNLLLSEIPKHQDNNKDTKYLDALLPWSKNVQDKCPSRFKKS